MPCSRDGEPVRLLVHHVHPAQAWACMGYFFIPDQPRWEQHPCLYRGAYLLKREGESYASRYHRIR